jgi:iron(III) transport system substrate-binding protein
VRALAALLSVALLVACGDKALPGHVVIYAHEGTRAQHIEEMLAEFTAETGILVTIKFGASSELTDAVIGKQDAPRADILLTADAADIWRAADNGALRPLPEETLERVPTPLQDPDGYWIAATAISPVIVVADEAPTFVLDGIGDLGGTEFKGHLCLSSSALPGSRALVAALIESNDNKTVERMVRSFVHNLALPPFETEAKLVDAVRSGACELGVLTGNTQHDSLARFWPSAEPRSFHINGIGVARHATDADAAQQLVAWIAGRQGTRVHEDVEYIHAGVAGWRDEEARLLAERAGYR